MEGLVTLSREEQKRLKVLNQVERGEAVGWEAAQVLGVSLRHIRRLLAAYRKEGAQALAHGNRGRKPWNAVDGVVRGEVLDLARTTYAGCNTQHFTELLGEREGRRLSRSTVRRILLGAGISGPRKRRPPRHRKRRERYAREGMLVQIDGSRHDWLEGRGPWMTLTGAIDDATGKVLHALFREQEDALGYFQLLQQVVTAHGIPLALYHDGHAVFERSEYEPESLEEQLDGKKRATQFGRLTAELNITSIRSRSPQARGRVERLWGTFQDRLVSELRLAGARTIGEANQVLWDYLPRHNQRFAVLAAQPDLAFRQPERDLSTVFCFKYSRTVGLDNVVRFRHHRLQVLPTNGRYSYARAKVDIHQALDGCLSVFYQGSRLTTRPAPAEATKLRKVTMPTSSTAEQTRRYTKPAPDHPWRGRYRQFIDKAGYLA